MDDVLGTWELDCDGLLLRQVRMFTSGKEQGLIMGGVTPRVIIQEEEEERLGIADW